MNNKNLEELKKRDLDKCYFCLYAVSVDVYVNLDNKINPQKVYHFYGCNLTGKRRYIASIIDSNLTTSQWYNFFQSFKNRNLEQIIYACIPDNKAMKDALKLAYLNIEIIISIFDAINKVYKYFSSGYSNSILSYIKSIYLANDLNEYDVYLNNFKEMYPNAFALDLLESNFKRAKEYYFMSIHLRKAIFAFYFLRDNIKRLMVIGHSKQYFSNLDDYLNSCISLFQSFETKTYCSKKDWLEILNTLYDSKKELIKSYL